MPREFVVMKIECAIARRHRIRPFYGYVELIDRIAAGCNIHESAEPEYRGREILTAGHFRAGCHPLPPAAPVSLDDNWVPTSGIAR